jgi:hypothetical protein
MTRSWVFLVSSSDSWYNLQLWLVRLTPLSLNPTPCFLASTLSFDNAACINAIHWASSHLSLVSSIKQSKIWSKISRPCVSCFLLWTLACHPQWSKQLLIVVYKKCSFNGRKFKNRFLLNSVPELPFVNRFLCWFWSIAKRCSSTNVYVGEKHLMHNHWWEAKWLQAKEQEQSV